MAEADVVFRVKAEGAQEAAALLGKAGNQIEKVGTKSKKAGEKAKTGAKGVDALAKSSKKARASIGLLGKALLTVGAAFAIRGIARFTKGAFDAAVVQEDAVKRLEAALASQGPAALAASQGLQDYASSLQKTTRFGDEAILQMQTLALRMGVAADELKEFTPLALDLATSVFDGNLTTATRQLSQAFGGNVETLGRYMPKLREMKKEGASTAEMLQAMRDQVGGAAQADIGTMGGAVEQLGNTWGDLKEELILGVTESGNMAEAVQGLQGFVESLIPVIKRASETLAPFVTTLAEAAEFGVLSQIFGGVGETGENELAATAAGKMLQKKREIANVERELASLRSASISGRNVTDADSGLTIAVAGEAEQARLIHEQLVTREALRSELAGITAEMDAQKGVAAETLRLEKERADAAAKAARELAEEKRIADELVAASAKAAKAAADKAKREAEALAKVKQGITDRATLNVVMAGRVGEVSESLSVQGEVLASLKESNEGLHRQLLKLWSDGKVGAEEYDAIHAQLITSTETLTEKIKALTQAETESRTARLDAIREQAGFGELGADVDTRGTAAVDITGGVTGGEEDRAAREERATAIMEINTLLAESTIGYAEALERAAAAQLDLTEKETKGLGVSAKQGVMTKQMSKLQGMFGGALKQTAQQFVAMAIAGDINMKKLLNSFLTGIAQEAGVSALMELAKGIAAAAVGNPAAAGHFKAAAVFGAVAAVAGAGAAATAGGGESGGGSTASGSSSAVSSDNQAAQAEEVEEERGRTINVTFTADTNGATSPEEYARMVESLVNEAEGQSAGRSGSVRG